MKSSQLGAGAGRRGRGMGQAKTIPYQENHMKTVKHDSLNRILPENNFRQGK